ncbi:hypothetical protein [Desulfobacter sp.]
MQSCRPAEPVRQTRPINRHRPRIRTRSGAGAFHPRTPDQTWETTFSNPPQQISLPSPLHTMIQREALGLDQTNGNIFITSEKALAPIYVVEPQCP